VKPNLFTLISEMLLLLCTDHRRTNLLLLNDSVFDAEISPKDAAADQNNKPSGASRSSEVASRKSASSRPLSEQLATRDSSSSQR